MPIIIWGMSIVNASDTSCWEWKWIVPTTTYASWIVYWCDGNTPIITIYWENWNWEAVWITIKAMNEWASVIWAKNDSTGSYWYHFQWWNNHGFESCYSDGCKTFPWWEWTGSIQVDVSNYGPVGKSISWYYDSGTWIKQNKWSTDNRNLWGGSWDYWTNHNGIYNWAFWWFNTWDFTVTNSWDRKWMCPQWYHIPSEWEWSALLYLWWKNYDTNQWTLLFTGWSLNSLNYNNSLNRTGNRFSEDMQMPFVGYRSSDGVVRAGDHGSYWSSSPYDGADAHRFRLDPNSLYANIDYNRGYGYAVRCFKNSYVKLPKTLNLFFMSDGEEVWTWEVTENMTGAVPEKAKNMTKTWYVLEYRYLSGADATTWFDFETTPILWAWADESGNVYFIAQWTGIKYSVEFTWTDIEWTMPNQEFTYGIAQNLTANTFTRDWYTFSGWTDWTTWYTDGQEVVNLTTTSGDVITLTAEWIPTEYTITYELDGWTNSENNTWIYTIETPDITLENPTKDWYTFDGWFIDSQFTTWITTIPTWTTWDITLYAKWTENKKPSWGSSGWGGRSSKTSDTKDSSDKSSEWQEILSPSDSSFTKEQKDAYEFAKEKWITTMPTIQEAQMDWKLTRIAMAKMLSQYAMNVLWQKPANIVTPKFNDVTDKQNSDYDDWVTLAYQLWIMWQNMPNNKFRPNDEVSRAEFATALSRMLYNTSDGEYRSTPKYYIHHMEKLVKEWIITNDDPMMKELRGYVMIMLMRSAK